MSTLLDQSALLEVFKALKAADIGDRVRSRGDHALPNVD
jgi:hypothetical protein